MSYIVRQKDIEVLMQSDKTLFYKLELLNKDMKTVDCIEGNLISDNLSIDASSDVRRTYNCELLVTDSTFDIGYEKRIFFDRYIRPHVGIRHNRSGEILWYSLGTFVFVDTNYHYNDTTKSLSLTCNDLMCMLNGVRGGNLDSYKRTITAGTSARAAIISLLQEVGITRYIIEFNINNHVLDDFQIPYDMVYNAGTNVYQIISEIVSLYPGTQMYFDLNGTFIINRIPTSKNETVILNDDILQPILIDEQFNTSFKDIYNHIQIYGKMLEPEYYSKDVTCNNNVYNVNLIVHKLNEDTGEFEEIEYNEQIDNFEEFCLLIPKTNQSQQYININGIGNVLIVDEEGNPLKENTLAANRDCVFRYKKENNSFLYVGEYQVQSELYLSNDINNKDVNAIIDIDNEYVVEKIGRKLKVLSCGDFEKITSSELCKDRCKLELYNATNKVENLSLNTLCIPFLDVNNLIEFTSNSNNKKQKFLIDNINCNFADHTMSISAHNYYASYIGNS